MEVEEVPVTDVAEAYARLAAGDVVGRAVARPGLLPRETN
jgi:D-arabinose 1-dehydrogenase-like Zn-dependent alcohol dehydrogenase